ncbi:DUF600 domain-containing protein [Tumebacillus sp. ITR2]|uniref:DUF600 domain-containing protein n=1 Tax=Tumebacillus amylolyticus TaxID=2801339 RepID=A0ABS1J654_9BACL|nr:DUF600 domain-containing protein [Tumebacillus amylolyticus]MBL0385763.1 DUF600 domain-containing protein [Tumebacillus amylolyticus]
MQKIFEDTFSELQADMVSICLEYVRDRADKIYIYCSHEEGMISSNFFYCINGQIVKKNKLNDALTQNANFAYDTSVERQRGVVRVINDNILGLINLCKKYSREMPTEMKLVYDVEKNKLVAEYKYDLVYTPDPDKTADDIVSEWFEQVRADNGK